MKFKIGDKVRAITNDYVVTTAEGHWEGVVTHVHENGEFDAKTTNYVVEGFFDEEFFNLKMDDFKLIGVNENVIRIRGCENAYEVADTLMQNGYWVKVTPHGDDYNCDCLVYFKESEEF